MRAQFGLLAVLFCLVSCTAPLPDERASSNKTKRKTEAKLTSAYQVDSIAFKQGNRQVETKRADGPSGWVVAQAPDASVKQPLEEALSGVSLVAVAKLDENKVDAWYPDGTPYAEIEEDLLRELKKGRRQRFNIEFQKKLRIALFEEAKDWRYPLPASDPYPRCSVALHTFESFRVERINTLQPKRTTSLLAIPILCELDSQAASIAGVGMITYRASNPLKAQVGSKCNLGRESLEVREIKPYVNEDKNVIISGQGSPDRTTVVVRTTGSASPRGNYYTRPVPSTSNGMIPGKIVDNGGNLAPSTYPPDKNNPQWGARLDIRRHPKLENQLLLITNLNADQIPPIEVFKNESFQLAFTGIPLEPR